MNYARAAALILTVGLVLGGGTAFGEATAGTHAFSGLPVDLLEVVVTPHQYSDEFEYSRKPDPELGTLVRLVVAHRDPKGAPVPLSLRFNGKKPSELIAAKEWQWHETPENLGTSEQPYTLAPGQLAVFTFNAGKTAWGVGKSFTLSVSDAEGAAPEEVTVPLRVSSPRIRSVVCLASDASSLQPDQLLVHVSNSGDAPLKIAAVRAYPTMRLSEPVEGTLTPFTPDGMVPPGDRSGAFAKTGPLPLRHGLVETVFESAGGAKVSRWAALRFKADRFDIGSGWLEIPALEGKVPILQETYLKTLTRMHVNLMHVQEYPGYTDNDGPDGLYTRYPMRLMSGFEDIEKYNSDQWVARIHGVDILGEPQMGLTPMESYETLKRYDPARYPTTVTLSDEKDWRYFAGLSDFPHFDSYRVSAPAMDAWHKYAQWDKKIMWGAPLEGIGTMTRSLRELSEPLPVALWSQNAHEGWQGQFSRKRRSPTPDEVLLQAYEGLANGVIGLYWYSLQSWSLVKYRDCIEVTTRIGRGIRLLEDLYMTGIAAHHARVNGQKRPELDLNVVAGPMGALCFALDLTYQPDHETRVFTFGPPRPVEAEFPLPGFAREPVAVFRADADGLHDVAWQKTDGGVRITDTLDKVAVYVATRDAGLRERLTARLAALKAAEEAIGFDPANNDEDFAALARDLGVEDLSRLDRFK